MTDNEHDHRSKCSNCSADEYLAERVTVFKSVISLVKATGVEWTPDDYLSLFHALAGESV